MRKITATALALLLLVMAGCSGLFGTQTTGQSNGPTSVIVEREQAMASPESSQPESLPEPETTDEPMPEAPPVPESPPAATAVPTASPAPTATPKPTAKPTATPKPTTNPTGDGKPEFSLSPSEVRAGDYMLLTCKNPPPLENLNCENSLPGIPHFFMNDDGEAVALVAISRNSVLGDQQLIVSSSLEKTVLPYTVVDAGFEREEFEMAESVQNSTVNSNTARDEYNRITANVMAAGTAEPKVPDFDSFIMPVNPPTFKISSSYGYTRIVNGKVSGRHEGVDFPAPKGTPVVAAGDGKVLYAGLMQMTGNTVVIEHGAGLKSWYQHLDSLSCSTGDLLEAGDPVGKVGTTGYSTGNHLHFGMSVNDIYTDPWQFIPRP